MAILQGKPEEIQAWLDRGGDPNAYDEDLHHSLLSYLMESGTDDVRRLKITRMLFAHGADLQRSPGVLTTAVSQHRAPEMIKLLLEHTTDVDDTTGWLGGWTALAMAARNGDTVTVKLLLDAGADPTKRLDNGDTALDVARKGNNRESVQILEKATAAWKPRPAVTAPPTRSGTRPATNSRG
jgi:ankyrin repeat protein